MNKLLIVVDMQNDFIDGVLGTPEAQNIVPAVAKRIREAVQDGDAILFTRDTHGADYLETQEGKRLPVEHCIKGTHGWQLADAVQEAFPLWQNCVINKPTFGSMALAEMLKGRSFDGIELIGLCTDICVISNAMLVKAVLPQVPVCVRADCCAGVTPQSHQTALEAMKMCQIEIV